MISKSSPTLRPSSERNGSSISRVSIAGSLSVVDKRDPTTLGEQLLEFKRRYRFKTLSRAYERMMDQ